MSLNESFKLVLISTFISLFLVGCGGGSDSATSEPLPVVAAGDFTTMRAGVLLAGMPELFRTADVNNSEQAHLDIYFDINNDGLVSKDDLVINLGIVQSASTGERRLVAALRQLLSDSPYVGEMQLAEIEYEIIGHEILFTISKSQSEQLNLISTSTQICVVVVTSDENSNVSSDELPDYRVYTQVQNVSQLTDPALDYYGNNSVIDILEFQLDLY